MPTEPPPSARRDDGDRETSRERIWRELIRRLLETGYEKISEGPENVRQFVSELKLPKEALALILSQLDETKVGLYRVVAKEIRDFLEHTNFADELVKVLTMVSFELKTEVRFIPNDSRGGGVPGVRAKVRVKRTPSTPPQPSTEAPAPAEQPEDGT